MAKILVVDDEKRIRETCAIYFADRGHDVFQASDAVSGFSVVDKEGVDLVLLDLNLGEIQGDTLNDVIASFHPKVLVVVSSVFPVEDQKEFVSDADEYHDKADGWAVLEKKVNRLLNIEDQKAAEQQKGVEK
ncbi:MAG: response regulator [Candidatus Omnitrophica bacterium]|nr:response regulator [Candidatus Omnitrophota bacterium]